MSTAVGFNQLNKQKPLFLVVHVPSEKLVIFWDFLTFPL